MIRRRPPPQSEGQRLYEQWASKQTGGRSPEWRDLPPEHHPVWETAAAEYKAFLTREQEDDED